MLGFQSFYDLQCLRLQYPFQEGASKKKGLKLQGGSEAFSDISIIIFPPLSLDYIVCLQEGDFGKDTTGCVLSLSLSLFLSLSLSLSLFLFLSLSHTHTYTHTWYNGSDVRCYNVSFRVGTLNQSDSTTF